MLNIKFFLLYFLSSNFQETQEETSLVVFVSFISLAIKVRNSGTSMIPLPSESTSLIKSWSSASLAILPRDLRQEEDSLERFLRSLYNSPQLPGSDGAVSVFVKSREGFLELGNSEG